MTNLTSAESAPAAVTAESAPPPVPTVETYIDHLRRLQAEFDNYRKRMAKDRATWNAQARGGVIEKLLPVMDNFGFALLIPNLTHDVKVGLEMVLKQFREVLVSEGAEEVPGVGSVFDTRWHEALESAPDSAAEGTIIAGRRSGWKMGDRLLRAAQVTVSGGPEEKK